MEISSDEREHEALNRHCSGSTSNKEECSKKSHSVKSWSCHCVTDFKLLFQSDECGYCGKLFPQPPNWIARESHIQFSHRPQRCEQKFFSSKTGLIKHLKFSHAAVSLNRKPEFYAAFAEEPLTRDPEPSLSQAQITHETTTDSELKCIHEDCKTLKFQRPGELKKHMDRHNRPYKCDQKSCERLEGFTYAGGLTRHQRAVHRMFGGAKDHRCPVISCSRHNKPFNRKENLKAHMRTQHPDCKIGSEGEEGDSEEGGTEEGGTKEGTADLNATVNRLNDIVKMQEERLCGLEERLCGLEEILKVDIRNWHSVCKIDSKAEEGGTREGTADLDATVDRLNDVVKMQDVGSRKLHSQSNR